MILRYYNQNNYGHVPYPSPTLPSATVKSGGCGVCCGAMIVSSMTDKIVDPVAMAAYAIAKGARVAGGTDMNVLAKAICADYGLVFSTTNDEAALLKHLAAGGMAVVNVGGNRTGWTGVFSSEGHFIVAAGCNGNTVTIMDPGYYAGKFNLAGRKGKVTVSGNFCYCDISVLASDTANRNPAYYLFSTVKEVIDMALETWQKEGGQEALKELAAKGLVNNIENWNSEAELAKSVPAYLFWMLMARLADYKTKG